MNDFETLKNIFEMAEVLELEGENTLELLTTDEKSGKSATVIFNFNELGDLTEVYVQE